MAKTADCAAASVGEAPDVIGSRGSGAVPVSDLDAGTGDAAVSAPLAIAPAATLPAEPAPAAAAPRRARDHRVDLVRGAALTIIFVNHMPGHWIGNWTPRNFGFSDAAEVFVLLAGYAAAHAYQGAFARHDTRACLAKALRRAGQLYAAHLVTTLAAFLLFWSVLALTREPGGIDLIGVSPIFANPSTSLMALLVGGFQLSYFNILPLYVVLLTLLPAMLWLAARDLRLLAAAVCSAYLLAAISGAALPSASGYESWYFNPLTWQALFAAGVVLGIRRLRGQPAVPYHPALYAAAAAYVAFALVWRLTRPDDDLGEGFLPYWLGSLQKPNLPLPRLLHVLALAYVVGYGRIWTWAAGIDPASLLVRMGRHSLPIFMAGSLLSMGGWLLMAGTRGAPATNMLLETAIALAGFTLMAALALRLDGDLGRTARRHAATARTGMRRVRRAMRAGNNAARLIRSSSLRMRPALANG